MRLVTQTHACFAAATGLGLATVAFAAAQPRVGDLPARLEAYLTNEVRLTLDERRRLAGGAPLTKLLEVDESKEVAVFAAVWINAPVARYIEAVNAIEQFERGGGFRVTRRLSQPPRLEDFADLHLPDSDIQDLRTCRAGACKVKLDENALRRFRTDIDWRMPDPRPAADALMRELLLEYVNRYLDGGNDRLGVYRDHSPPTVVGLEFRAMAQRMPELATFMPDVRRYLLDFPDGANPGWISFLYWQETDFGLKPTIRVNHLVVRQGSDETVVASKMLYATHYFLTALELRILIPDPSRGPGFWLIMVNRARADGLGGFRGLFVRGRVRSQVLNGALAALRVTKRRLENGG